MGLIGTTLFVINTMACIGALCMAVDIEEAVEQACSNIYDFKQHIIKNYV